MIDPNGMEWGFIRKILVERIEAHRQRLEETSNLDEQSRGAIKEIRALIATIEPVETEELSESVPIT